APRAGPAAGERHHRHLLPPTRRMAGRDPSGLGDARVIAGRKEAFMKRMLVTLLVAASIPLGGGVARADAQPCNRKAIAHTALHLARAQSPVRIRILTHRYERLRSRCFVSQM